jgi:hypothetical protein
MTDFDRFLHRGQHFEAGLSFGNNERGWDRVYLEAESFAPVLAPWAH